jgi:hypothetical protein
VPITKEKNSWSYIDGGVFSVSHMDIYICTCLKKTSSFSFRIDFGGGDCSSMGELAPDEGHCLLMANDTRSITNSKELGLKRDNNGG